MNRPADILRDGAAQDLHFAGVGIDLNIHAYRRKSVSDFAGGVERRPTNDGTASPREPADEFLEADGRGAVLHAEGSAIELDFLGSLLENLCRTLLQLSQSVVRRFVNGQPRRDSHAAPASTVRITNRVGITDQRTHVPDVAIEH